MVLDCVPRPFICSPISETKQHIHRHSPQDSPKERLKIQHCGTANSFRMTARRGSKSSVFNGNFSIIFYNQLEVVLSTEITYCGVRIHEYTSGMFATQDSAYEKQVVYILGEGELRMRQAFPLMVKESKLPHGIVDGERMATTNFMDAVSWTR